MKKAVLSIMPVILCATSYSQNTDVMIPSELPREQIIHHKGFSVSYSSAYVLSSWVTYKVTNSNVDKESKHKAKYLPDPNISTRSADKKDYKDSGYLMAQICSYLDVAHIDGAIEETFYMSNIAPMKLAFYQHMWLKTEDLIRLWAKGTEGLYIIAGAITKEAPFPTIGKNKLAIPKHYYKVVYNASNNEALAFKFKNGMSSGSLKSYTIPIDKLEDITGIDFFPDMEEEVEQKMESAINYDAWNFELEDEL